MEKTTVKSKNKILNFLPKVAQASVSFQSPPPFSPAGRSKLPDLNVNKLRAKIKKGISGPIVSMIPVEARRNSKNSETQEPISPKVSCMGQIKHRNKICKGKQVSLEKEFDRRPVYYSPGHMKNNKTRPDRRTPEPKKKPEVIRKVFSERRRSDASIDHAKTPLPDRAPSLSEMLRFASSRDTLGNFDWTTARISAEEDVDFNSDEEGGYRDEEYDAIIPVSAVILVSGSGAGLTLEPRKEINLWKRRTIAKPKPLQLNLIRAQ